MEPAKPRLCHVVIPRSRALLLCAKGLWHSGKAVPHCKLPALNKLFQELFPVKKLYLMDQLRVHRFMLYHQSVNVRPESFL